MSLELRLIDDYDYVEIAKWLKQWKQEIMPQEFYPETGLMLYDTKTNEGVYCGYVWVTNSKAYPIGCTTRNPFYKSKKLDKQTLQNFILALTSYAKDLGAKHIMTWAESEILKENFRQIGMAETSNKCSEFKAILK